MHSNTQCKENSSYHSSVENVPSVALPISTTHQLPHGVGELAEAQAARSVHIQHLGTGRPTVTTFYLVVNRSPQRHRLGPASDASTVV